MPQFHTGPHSQTVELSHAVRHPNACTVEQKVFAIGELCDRGAVFTHPCSPCIRVVPTHCIVRFRSTVSPPEYAIMTGLILAAIYIYIQQYTIIYNKYAIIIHNIQSCTVTYYSNNNDTIGHYSVSSLGCTRQCLNFGSNVHWIFFLVSNMYCFCIPTC